MRRVVLFLFTAAACLAQGPKLLIVTDMEGVGGVNNAEEQLLPGQRRFDESKRLLVGELSAAVRGAFAGGAAEITIWDGHDGSRALSIDDVPPKTRLIQGRPTPANYYMTDRAYDAILFVGQHAMAGAKGGVLAHSQSFNVERITLNGRSVGEIGQVAAIGGYFNIPVIMLAGDQAACDELRELQPKAETVAVKRLAGRASTNSLSHREATALIEGAARRAVSRIREFTPWRVEGPVELKFEFVPGKGNNATYRGQTVLEAFEGWLGKVP